MSDTATMPDSAIANLDIVSILTAELLTTQQAADIVGLTKWTLAYWRAQRLGPPFMLISRRCIRYSRAQLESWLKARIHTEGARVRAYRRGK